MKNMICVCLVVPLISCARPGVNDGRFISEGQWTTPVPVGNGRHLIQGYNTHNAITGATEFCAWQGKEMVTDDIKPGTLELRANITFHCS